MLLATNTPFMDSISLRLFDICVTIGKKSLSVLVRKPKHVQA